MKVKKSFLVFLGLFILLLVLAPCVLAVSGKPKVTEVTLRACRAKENSIKKRMSQLEKLATKMLEKFSEIQGRVGKYYIEKVIPSGKVVANYNILTADIQTKKTAVQTAVEKIKTNSSGFSCADDDPKEQMKQFREGMQEVKSALKDYRTAIRNLIVAVRSLGKNKI